MLNRDKLLAILQSKSYEAGHGLRCQDTWHLKYDDKETIHVHRHTSFVEDLNGTNEQEWWDTTLPIETIHRALDELIERGNSNLSSYVEVCWKKSASFGYGHEYEEQEDNKVFTIKLSISMELNTENDEPILNWSAHEIR